MVSLFNESLKEPLGFNGTDRQFTLIQQAVKEPFQAWLGLHGSENTLKSSIDRLKKIIFHCTDQDQVHDQGSRSANTFNEEVLSRLPLKVKDTGKGIQS